MTMTETRELGIVALRFAGKGRSRLAICAVQFEGPPLPKWIRVAMTVAYAVAATDGVEHSLPSVVLTNTDKKTY
jgi:hypothetical protein